jgi:hypothetical protein
MADIKRIAWVTVVGSESMTGPGGTTALCLRTKEAGSVAFAVDQRAIDAIRGHLDKLELMFQTPGGQA